MRNARVLVAFLFVLISATYAEGQEVQLEPKHQTIQDVLVHGFSNGQEWAVSTTGIRTALTNRASGATEYLMVGGNGLPYLSLARTSVSKNFLAGAGGYFIESAVGVFDVHDLNPTVTNQYNFQVHLPNWEVRSLETNFGRHTFINELRHLVGVSHGNGVYIYELLGDTSPIQEIYSDVIWMTSTPDGEYFAVSNGIDISLYAYDTAQEGYVLKARYLPSDYLDNPAHLYGSKMSLSMYYSELILVVSDGGSGGSDVRMVNPLSGTITSKIKVDYGMVTCAEQQYALFGQQGKIVHLPSGQAIGNITTYGGGEFLGSILLSEDGRQMELFTIENIYGEGIADKSYISEYEEEMLEAQYQVSQLEANWGTVKVYGSPWIFKGGSYRLVVVAHQNKKIGKLSYSSANEKRVKTAKNKGGWILDLSNVQSDVLVQAEFVAMTPANKKARKKVVTGNPIFLWGLSEKKAKTSFLLLNGNYLGWDEYEYEYSIVVSDSGVEITWYKLENQAPDRTLKSTLSPAR